eukprot:496141-Prymnesium_polylepis.1
MACFRAPVTTLLRENAVTETGQYAEQTSTGGIKFSLQVKEEELQVPDSLGFNMNTSEGTVNGILNRYENIFVAHERYKRCCGRDHADTCWTKRPKGPARTAS